MLGKAVLLFLLFKFCMSTDTINLNEPITDGNVLLSKNGNFALGFFRAGNSNFKYIGIWYNKLPGKTVVWVANREKPISSSSPGFLSINPDGNLVLHVSNHDQKIPLWFTNISMEARTEDCCVAQLQDSGNLVLVQSESKRIVWQSFDYPTDTVLPGQKLGIDRRIGLDRTITSWKSADDPGSGNWLHKLVPAGCPQFILLDKGLTTYWRSSPWPWAHESHPVAVYNQDEIYSIFLPEDGNLLSRIVVNSSGMLQLHSWDNSSLRWRETRSQPSYKYGYCGAYSILNANNIDGVCICLPGYQPKSLTNWFIRDNAAGCTRKNPETSICGNREGFLKIESVKVPDTSIAALLEMNLSIRECEQLCLRNCSCKAFASFDMNRNGVGCLTWYGELMDTMKYSNGRDLYVRVDATELAKYAKKEAFLGKKGMLAIPIVSAALVVFIIVLSVFIWLRNNRYTEVKKKSLSLTLEEKEAVDRTQTSDLSIFDLCTISAATNNFSPSNKLGQGGFGSVYKGQLHDGQEIAVKRLSHGSEQGTSEFKTEAVLIAKLQHRNLVKLIGCCTEGEEQMLIYEYLPNKSLDCFIFDHAKRFVLDWRKRFDIIIGVARGILYLHHDSRLRIIHRDLKTSNILLDNNMNPRISDFGMARIFKGEQESHDKTNRVVGTYGYMAPEYVIFGKYSVKSDVFSFGMIVLEIISGKKSNTCYSNSPSLNLIGQVWDLWKENRVLDMVDSSLEATLSSLEAQEVSRCIQIGLLCVQENATDRPNMSTVVLMLNGETSLPTPKQPAFILGGNNTPPKLSHCSVNDVTITKVEAR